MNNIPMPLQAKFTPHNGLSGPSSCRSTGPAPPGLFQPSSCLSCPAQRWELLPHTGLSGSRSSLTPAHWGPAHASRGLSRPSPCMWAGSPVPASTSQWALSGPTSCLAVAPLGQTPALRGALQAQLLPPSGPCRPSSCLDGALPRPRFCFWWPLQAQNLTSSRPLRAWLFLLVASAGPSHTQVGFPWPSSCLSAASPGAQLPSATPGLAPPASRWPLYAQPSSCLLAAFPGPTFDSWWPLQALNLTSCQPLRVQPPASRRPVYRLSFCLTVHSPTPRLQPHCGLPSPKFLPSGGFNRARSCLPMASPGPAHPSQWPFRAQFVRFWWPLQTCPALPPVGLSGPALPPGGLCRPKFPSSRPLRDQLLGPGGLYRPKSSSSPEHDLQ
ncbi:putative uncharacterized protein FLJ44672 [Papio anubis]|uniref:putative uncharacterized protein FLJ44672 n=1 Tax=Papio anubis TaxID=9555 RepID=UPI0012ADCE9E|nr:putative uncharacterized protein FLJ44672 [Papio anubis]